MVKKTIAASVLFTLLASPVLASTTVISSLGEAPLLGELRSTQDLTQQVFKQTPRLNKAARQLGLTPDQFDEFTTDIATDENVRWVTVPRHLDGMSWESAGRVHVIRDVMIPANTHGWAVYLKTGVTVYVPAKCGNLSVLHTPVRHVAAVKAASAPAPVVEAPAAPAEAPPPVAVAPAPAEFPTPTPLAAIPPPPPVHHSLLPLLGGLLLLPLIVLAGGGPHGGTTGFLPSIGGGSSPSIIPGMPSIPVPSIGGGPPIGGGSPPGGGGGGGGMCCGCGCD
jgi:hypothetical protein